MSAAMIAAAMEPAAAVPPVEAFVMTFTVYSVEVIAVKVLEVITWLVVSTMPWKAAPVAVTRVKVVIHGAVESASTVIPGASTNK